ncbi:hypothetical protein HAX54_035834 [Datura stramonium]|uniref:PUB 12/19-like N-terminal domain-containing protein n=1 Tax=Datura stramonium TaxID=4076 RepID=A0ABS8RM60_DATST|nr:hypothetical protein [Datura stramonium]
MGPTYEQSEEIHITTNIEAETRWYQTGFKILQTSKRSTNRDGFEDVTTNHSKAFKAILGTKLIEVIRKPPGSGKRITTTGSYEEYRRLQREECHDLFERLQLLLPLFEEIRDLKATESGIEFLMKLKKAFSSAKKLLKTCHCGSKIYLAIESEAVMGRFYSVELLRVQFRRAKKRNVSQDMELTMDLMVALSTNNDRNADSASIDRSGHKLGLRIVEDLKVETISVRKVVKERKGRHAEETQKILDLLNKFRRFAGLEEIELLMPKAHEKRLWQSQKNFSVQSHSRIQENAVTALLNLSIDETNKKLISKEEPIPTIIEILQNGNVGAKENSAAALFSLSMLDEKQRSYRFIKWYPHLNRIEIRNTIRGKKDAITALFNLCFSENGAYGIEAGIKALLFQLLEKKNLEMLIRPLSILLLFCNIHV